MSLHQAMAPRLTLAFIAALTAASCSSSTNAAQSAVNNAGPDTTIEVTLTASGFSPPSVLPTGPTDVRITVNVTQTQRLQVVRDDEVLVDLGKKATGSSVIYRAEKADKVTTITADPSGAVLTIGTPGS
jgi:hypothetical protein